MKTVLFLCTGNYYRSRYAELLFNWKVEKNGLRWRAVSRGLAPDPRNPGSISIHTLEALKRQKIPVGPDLRLPLKVTDADFRSSQHIVAVKAAEHRPLIEREFPDWLTVVEFWHVHDLDCAGPDEAIPHLAQQVNALLLKLAECSRITGTS